MSATLVHSKVLELIEKAHNGDNSARDELVINNIALVKSIVKKFLNRGMEYDDLFQLGSIGLVKAIDNFAPEFNVRFSTYAVPMIAGEIKRHLRDDGILKVSRSLKEIAAKAAAASEKLKKDLQRDPTINEIAKVIGAKVEDILMAQEASRGCMSLSEPVFEDESGELGDTLAVATQENNIIDLILLKQLIGELEPRERQIIMLRYFQDKTQSEIANLLGVSQVQVSRLECRIIKKMQQAAIG